METRDSDARLVSEAFAAATVRPGAEFERRMRRALAAEQARNGERRASAASWRGLTVGRRTLVALAALLVASVAAMAMVYPPSRAALASVPGLGYLGTLFGGPSAPAAAPLAQATSNGYTVSVTGAYDDGTTVILHFQVTRADRSAPPIDDAWPLAETISDAAGNPMQGTFTPVRQALDTHNAAANRPAEGSAAGTALTVHVTQIQRVGPDFRPLVPGKNDGFQVLDSDWTLHFSIRAAPQLTELPLPAGGGLDGATVTFQTVRANDAYLHLQFRIDGLTCADAKGGCGPNLAVHGPDGRMLTWLNGSGGPSGGPTGPGIQTSEYQLAGSPGTYRIVLTGTDGATLVRTVNVPKGRSGNVPQINPKDIG
jgi:hypothetical protein